MGTRGLRPLQTGQQVKLTRWVTLRSLGSLRTSCCWCGRRCLQDRGCPHRESQASRPEPGRDDQGVVWTSLTTESLTAPRESWPPKASFLSGEETWPTCCVTSPPRLLTLPSRTASRPSSPPPRMPPTLSSLPPTSHPVVPLEP